jgi:hypothetical protein
LKMSSEKKERAHAIDGSNPRPEVEQQSGRESNDQSHRQPGLRDQLRASSEEKNLPRTT